MAGPEDRAAQAALLQPLFRSQLQYTVLWPCAAKKEGNDK